MADMPSGFWSGWIIVLTLFSLAGVAWLVWSIYYGRDLKEESEVEPIWDNNLEEGHNPPPLWWFWMLFGAMIFSLVYLMFFPGLGNYSGILNWSQGSRVAESYEDFQANFATAREEIVEMSLPELQNNLHLMDTAERIFRRECSACHGPEGRGQANMFPNLHDVDWQWGGSVEQIEQTIRGGRNANMIAWQGMLGDEGVNEVAEYVLTLDEGGDDSLPGQARYQQNCAACHGPSGDGNPMLGAPRLSDDIWLYGGSLETVKATIAHGRFGVMPAFNERLDDAQIKLLIALLAR